MHEMGGGFRSISLCFGIRSRGYAAALAEAQVNTGSARPGRGGIPSRDHGRRRLEQGSPMQQLLRPIAGALVAAAALCTTAPAIANSASDITAPLTSSGTARQAVNSGGDEQFRNLFASWQAMDRGGVAAPVARVSIPSRVPVDGYRMTIT